MIVCIGGKKSPYFIVKYIPKYSHIPTQPHCLWAAICDAISKEAITDVLCDRELLGAK
jgi:hypothetical protein